MIRNLSRPLLEWKKSARRKPLVLQGARQTGKTWLLKNFGRSHYEGVVYLNFEEDASLRALFAGASLSPSRIIKDLQVHLQRDIRPERDLLIFDEIQLCNEALNSLKYFCEEANGYHIAAAGSLLGVKLSTPLSFPVGKVNFLTLHPMTFFEFLDATAGGRYRTLLEEQEPFDSISEPHHEELIRRLKTFYFVGGMPEAVASFAADGNFENVRTIHKEILNSYILDFAKHAPNADVPRLSHLWTSIPSQLAQESKKFYYSRVQPGARARSYEDALLWLQEAGLIHRSWVIQRPVLPLDAASSAEHFKVYALDVGLLGALAGLSPQAMTQGTELFTTYRGALAENFVAQELVASDQRLHYWSRPRATAEVDFLLQVHDRILPLEVKAGINPKSKSLQSFGQEFDPPLLLRATLLNGRRDGRIANTPLYAVSLITKHAQAVISS